MRLPRTPWTRDPARDAEVQEHKIRRQGERSKPMAAKAADILRRREVVMAAEEERLREKEGRRRS